MDGHGWQERCSAPPARLEERCSVMVSNQLSTRSISLRLNTQLLPLCFRGTLLTENKVSLFRRKFHKLSETGDCFRFTDIRCRIVTGSEGTMFAPRWAGLDLVVNWNRAVLGPGEKVNSVSFFDVTSHCAGEFQSCRKVDLQNWPESACTMHTSIELTLHYS